MNKFGAWTLIGIGMLSVCGEAAASGALWEARTQVAQARQALQAAANAAHAGDAQAYAEHDAQARAMFEEARRLFENAGAPALQDAEALADYAQALQAFDDHDLAAGALRRAVRIEPDDAGLWLALGRSLMTPLYTRLDEAENALKQAARLAEGQGIEGDARGVLGRLYWEKGLPAFAETQWERALRVSPDNVTAQAGIAAVHARRGEMTEASNRIQEAAAANPEVLALAAAFLEKALDDFARSGLWFEDTAEAHFAYASLLLRVGRYTESLGPLERTVKLDPENHIAWNMVGSINAQLGQTERAREAFERSLELVPEQERTREALERLVSPQNAVPVPPPDE